MLFIGESLTRSEFIFVSKCVYMCIWIPHEASKFLCCGKNSSRSAADPNDLLPHDWRIRYHFVAKSRGPRQASNSQATRLQGMHANHLAKEINPWPSGGST